MSFLTNGENTNCSLLKIFAIENLHLSLIFFLNDTVPTEFYTLSLHDALPISEAVDGTADGSLDPPAEQFPSGADREDRHALGDRKSTRLNSSHMSISYAVFCLKKKKTAIR